ncbi:MAG: DUF3501 family protein [Spirochaetia bacterium]|nr:DUF3501 family protein [Spirochaetia bacterium]
MIKVQRSEILDYVTYMEKRNEIRSAAIAEKDKRRIHLGEHLTFLFENTDTIRYQILEMVRVEKMVKEEHIQHEIETYNGLLGDSGELSCTLLIEYTDPEIRDQKLRELAELPKHLYLKLDDGNKIYAEFDKEQVLEDKVSSVQFLKFQCTSAPEKIGCDHPSMTVELELSESQKEVLTEDLK